jgi:hypothetical protein
MAQPEQKPKGELHGLGADLARTIVDKMIDPATEVQVACKAVKAPGMPVQFHQGLPQKAQPCRGDKMKLHPSAVPSSARAGSAMWVLHQWFIHHSRAYQGGNRACLESLKMVITVECKESSQCICQIKNETREVTCSIYLVLNGEDAVDFVYK